MVAAAVLIKLCERVRVPPPVLAVVRKDRGSLPLFKTATNTRR